MIIPCHEQWANESIQLNSIALIGVSAAIQMHEKRLFFFFEITKRRNNKHSNHIDFSIRHSSSLDVSCPALNERTSQQFQMVY